MKKIAHALAASLMGVGLLLFTTSFQSPAVRAASVTFKDTVPAWAEASVETAVQAGILNGYPDGTFKPNNPISRAELLKVMALAFDLETVPTAGAWYSPYEKALADAKIYMDGDYSGNANNPATRNEMAKLAVRGANADYRGKKLSAKELMFRAVNAGLLSRTGTKAETIDPEGTTTRAQVAVLITRLLKVKNGEKLTVDKGASSAAEVAWHRHNMITMFNQNDLVALPYTKNINSSYDVVIEQLIILDPGDTTGFYSEYLKGVEGYYLDGVEVKPSDGYLFAYKLKGVSKVADPSQSEDVGRGSFYMLNEGSSGGFYLPERYMFYSLEDRPGLYANNQTFRFSTIGAYAFDFYYSYVDKDFIQSQIKIYGGLPIHLEKFAKQMSKSTQFYLTEVKDRQWQQ